MPIDYERTTALVDLVDRAIAACKPRHATTLEGLIDWIGGRETLEAFAVAVLEVNCDEVGQRELVRNKLIDLCDSTPPADRYALALAAYEAGRQAAIAAQRRPGR